MNPVLSLTVTLVGYVIFSLLIRLESCEPPSEFFDLIL